MEFLQEQIISQSGEAHPLHGVLRYDLGDDIEMLISKMPDDPDGLDWSQMQAVVAGLWKYMVTGMRYHTVTLDILDVDDDVQIGWGHVVKWEGDSLSDRIAKRGVQLTSLVPPLQLTSLVPPSSADLMSGQRNSSLLAPLNSPIDWQVKDTDMTLRFTPMGKGPQPLNPKEVRSLLAAAIEILQKQIATHGAKGLPTTKVFRHGKQPMLEIISRSQLLTWGELATVVLGLVEFIVDRNRYRAWYFTIYIQDAKVEIGIGQVEKGYLPNNNVTVA